MMEATFPEAQQLTEAPVLERHCDPSLAAQGNLKRRTLMMLLKYLVLIII